MIIKKTPQYLRDLDSALTYCETEQYSKATLAEAIHQTLDLIQQYPRLGRVIIPPDVYRKNLDVLPFFLVYQVKPGFIYVLDLLHHKRKWP